MKRNKANQIAYFLKLLTCLMYFIESFDKNFHSKYTANKANKLIVYEVCKTPNKLYSVLIKPFVGRVIIYININSFLFLRSKDPHRNRTNKFMTVYNPKYDNSATNIKADIRIASFNVFNFMLFID